MQNQTKNQRQPLVKKATDKEWHSTQASRATENPQTQQLRKK